MTMVAENATGLRNLFKLSSLASFEGQLGKWARMDAEIIAEHAEGIIATTGCPSGEVQTRLRLGHRQEALEAAAKWREIFGPENFFLELMDHGLDIERRVREGLLEIGRKLGIPPLATNDCHYVTREASQQPRGAAVHPDRQDAVGPDALQVRRRRLLPEVGRRDARAVGRPGSRGLRLDAADRRTGAALRRRVGAAGPDAGLPGPRRARPGVVAAPRGDGRAGAPLPERRRRVGARRSTSTRAEYEIKVICDKGFPSYFLIVADLINYAKSVDIRVGPGRGSAAGSLVAYAMGITNIDPIPHGLLFERFLNPERPSAPDIDIDFDDRRRGEMLRYAANKWGSDRVAQVITFGTIKTKAALKDSARVQLRPARLRDRRPDHQGAAAADHGQGHPALGHHRPDPRAVQGSRRGPGSDRHRSRRAHHLRDRARPGGPGPQRRRARVRGDHELRAADRRDPAVAAAAGRRGHHRLGLPVVRGHRPAEDGLPRACAT